MDFDRLRKETEIAYEHNGFREIQPYVNYRADYFGTLDNVAFTKSIIRRREEVSIIAFALFLEHIIKNAVIKCAYFKVHIEYRNQERKEIIKHDQYCNTADFTPDRFISIFNIISSMYNKGTSYSFVGKCYVEIERMSVYDMPLPNIQSNSRVGRTNDAPQHSKLYDALCTPDVLRTTEQERIIKEQGDIYNGKYKPIEYPKALMTSEMQEAVDAYNKEAEERYNRSIKLHKDKQRDIQSAGKPASSNFIVQADNAMRLVLANAMSMMNEKVSKEDKMIEVIFDSNIPKTITVTPAKVNITIEPINTIKLT